MTVDPIQGGAVTAVIGMLGYLVKWMTGKLNGSLEAIHTSNKEVAKAVTKNTEAVGRLTQHVEANTRAHSSR